MAPKKLPIPRQQADYSNDVYIEPSRSSDKHFADKNRKGIIEEHTECLTLYGHTDQVLSSPFFLSQKKPLPISTERAAIFIRDSSPNSALSLWNAQIRTLDKVILEPRPTELQWKACVPKHLTPAAGKVKLAALTHLTISRGIGAERWLLQFLFSPPWWGD